MFYIRLLSFPIESPSHPCHFPQRAGWLGPVSFCTLWALCRTRNPFIWSILTDSLQLANNLLDTTRRSRIVIFLVWLALIVSDAARYTSNVAADVVIDSAKPASLNHCPELTALRSSTRPCIRIHLSWRSRMRRITVNSGLANAFPAWTGTPTSDDENVEEACHHKHSNYGHGPRINSEQSAQRRRC